MYSYRSDYSDRRPHSDRNTRRRDDYDDRVSYHKHDGDRHSRTEKISRSKEYSDSPKRMYNKDLLNRDWAKKSPVRRRMSSPDQSSSENKRRRFTEDYYRHRRDPEDKTYRQSPEGFSRLNVSKEFKRTLPEEEMHDFRCTKKHKESRHRPIREEFTYRKQYDEYRPLSPHHKERDRHERRWDWSQEMTQLRDHSDKSHSKPRERDGDHCADYEDQCQNGQRFLSNGSTEQSFNRDVTNQTPGQKSTKGFQRFLDVLNKGVNVAMLTKIVTQTSQEVDRPCSPVPFANSTGLCSPVSTANQQGSNQINCHWSEHKGSQRLACPQPDHRSFSPQMPSMSEQSLQQCDGEQSYRSSKHRSKSPSVVENITLTPEDEYKHKQMQDVLQAIGMDLGFEELGQMSHRIKERLYGKKDDDWCPHHRRSKERDTRRTTSPSRQSRSSSSRSNVSPLTRDYMLNKVRYSAHRDVTELLHVQMHQAGDFGQNSSSGSLEHDKCETNSQESSAVLQTFSPSPAYTVSEAPVMPTYSPVNSSVLPYPPMTPVLPPVLPPHFPPSLPHGIPRLLLPHLPPILPYPHIPPLNIFPGVLTPNRHLLPQHINNPQSSIFSQSDAKSAQSLNAMQKSKTLSRPRCLQVIETKQPG